MKLDLEQIPHDLRKGLEQWLSDQADAMLENCPVVFESNDPDFKDICDYMDVDISEGQATIKVDVRQIIEDHEQMKRDAADYAETCRCLAHPCNFLPASAFRRTA